MDRPSLLFSTSKIFIKYILGKVGMGVEWEDLIPYLFYEVCNDFGQLRRKNFLILPRPPTIQEATDHYVIILSPYIRNSKEPRIIQGKMALDCAMEECMSDMTLSGWQFMHQEQLEYSYSNLEKIARKLAENRGYSLKELDWHMKLKESPSFNPAWKVA